MNYPIRRAIGDQLSPLSVQIKKNGVAVDLTNRNVEFALYDNDGNAIVPKTNVGVTIPNAVQGYVDYDFQSNAIPAHADVATYPDGRDYYGYFYVYDAIPGVEADQWPPDGLRILFFSPQRDQTVADTIDLLAAAQSPKRARNEEGSVEERSLDELIKADQYLKAQEAPGSVPWGVRMARIRYGSTTPGAGRETP